MSESPAEPERPGDAAHTADTADTPNGESTQGADQSAAETDAAETDAAQTDAAQTDVAQTDVADADAAESVRSLTFRILPISLLTVLVVAVCMTPLAFAQPALLSLYLIPLLLGAWVLRARTVVTTEKITAYAVRRVDLDWDDVRRFRLDERRWLRAVLNSGREVMLPAVRVRDLPNVAAMSGGRIPDPTSSEPAGAERTSTDQTGTTAGESAPE